MRKTLAFGAILGAYIGVVYGQLPPAPPSRLAVYASSPVYPAPKAVEFTPAWVVELRGEQIIGIAATGERVAVLTAAGELVGFSVKDGALVWRVHELAGAAGITVERNYFRVAKDPASWYYNPSDGTVAAEPAMGRVDGLTTPEGTSSRFARLMPDGRVEVLKPGRERPEWTVHAGTAFGTAPIVLRTSPGARRPRASELVVAGTMDGLLQGFRASSGQVAWTRRTAGRLTRPIEVWLDPEDKGADRTRLLVAAVGSRKIEAFRAVDGAAAGSQELGSDEALILAGPVVVPGVDACAVAWSPWPAAGSRVLLLALASVP